MNLFEDICFVNFTFNCQNTKLRGEMRRVCTGGVSVFTLHRHMPSNSALLSDRHMPSH